MKRVFALGILVVILTLSGGNCIASEYPTPPPERPHYFGIKDLSDFIYFSTGEEFRLNYKEDAIVVELKDGYVMEYTPQDVMKSRARYPLVSVVDARQMVKILNEHLDQENEEN